MIRRSGWVAHAAVVAAAVIFGSTFVVVQDGIKHARPVPFLAVRFLIGAVVLAAVGQGRRGVARRAVPRRPGLASAGLVAGTLLLMIEPVSAAIIGAIIGEHQGWAGAAGAGLILAGIAVAELRPLLPRRNPDRYVMLSPAEGTRSA